MIPNACLLVFHYDEAMCLLAGMAVAGATKFPSAGLAKTHAESAWWA
jgi:hypothetical protein